MRKNKSPLKHLEEGHLILNEKGHLAAHDGDALAAGVSVPEEVVQEAPSETAMARIKEGITPMQTQTDLDLASRRENIPEEVKEEFIHSPLVIDDETIDLEEVESVEPTIDDVAKDYTGSDVGFGLGYAEVDEDAAYHDSVNTRLNPEDYPTTEEYLKALRKKSEFENGYWYKKESTFKPEFSNEKGDLAYVMGERNVTHNEEFNGAVDWNTFNDIKLDAMAVEGGGSFGTNTETLVSKRLEAMHNHYQEQRKTENNPEGLDKNGDYYSFSYKSLSGDDELVITRHNYKYGDIEKTTIELPTNWSEDGEMTWQSVYKRYRDFLNPGKDIEVKNVDDIVYNWDEWATSLPKDAENLDDFYESIAPNETKTTTGSYYNGSKIVTEIGDSRGGISRQTLSNTTYKNGITYWTGGDGSYQKEMDGQGQNVPWKYFKYQGKTHTYAVGSGFVPPEYDNQGDLVDGGSIARFYEAKAMHDDVTRSRKVIEDLFYNSTTDKYTKVSESAADVGAATTILEPSETKSSNSNKLKELQQEQRDEIYSGTEVEGNITFLDITNRRSKTTNTIVESEAYKKSAYEAQAKFSLEYQNELEVLLEPHKVKIQNTLDEEFKVEISEVNAGLDKMYGSFELEDEKVINSLGEKVNAQLLADVESGSFDPVSNEEYQAEFKKRMAAGYKQHLSRVDKGRQDQIKSIKTPFNEKYSKRHNELITQYTGDFQERKTKELEDLHYKHQSEFIKKSYESKSNGAEQLISDEIYNKTFKNLQDENISGFGYEAQKEAINLAWRKMEVVFDMTLSEDEVDARREEFYYKAYTKISLDKDGRPTSSSMKMMAEETLAEFTPKDLKQMWGLSDAERASLLYAKKILESPEFMSSTAVGRYFDGMFSKELSDLIPIFAEVKQGNRQNYIRKLLQKPNEQLSEQEKEALVLWSEHKKLQSKISEMSTSYNAGAGTVDSFRFMLEMIASRGVGKIFAKGGRLALVGNRGRLAKRSQEVIEKFSKLKGIPVGTLRLQDKAVGVTEFLLASAGGTAVGGSGMVYQSTIERMTPEMAWSLTSDGENMVFEIDKLGFYTGDDANGNPIYEQDKGWDEAFTKAFKSTWVEYATESFGQYIPLGGKYLKKELLGDPVWLKRMVLGRYARKLGLNPASANFLTAVQRAGGWNGVIPEVMEEFIAQPLQNLIDGRGFLDGIDAKFTEEVIIQTAAMQVMFGAANKSYKMASGKKDPSYMVGDMSYSNAQDAVDAVVQAKADGTLGDLNVEINNDFFAFEEVYRELEGTGFENNLSSKNLLEVVNDVAASIEVEAVSRLPEKDVKKVEELTKQVEDLEEQKEALIKNNGKNKNEALDNIHNVEGEINKLNKEKNTILDPVITAVNTERSSEAYQQKLDAVKEFSEDVDRDTDVVELNSTAEAAEFYEMKALNDALSKYDIEVIRNAETGKRVYVDVKNNTTLSEKDLNQIDFGEGASFQDINKEIQDNKNEFDATHGFTTQTVDGKQSIVINKEASLKLGAKNVAGHEFLHRFLNKTFNKNPHLKLAIGRALETQLMSMNPNGIRNSNFRARILSYQAKQGDVISAEETLNFFSDALVSGEMIYNETFAVKASDMFRRAFSRGGKEVTFETGKDVMNFIRDYNKMIETKRMSKGMKATMLKGAKVGGEIKFGSDQYARKLKALGFERDQDGGAPLMSKATPLEAINELIPEEVKTKKQYDELISDPRRNKEIFESITKKNKVINNYIRSRQITKEEGDMIIENVTDRVLGFNPDEKRADGSRVGMEAFGERIFSDTRFGKLDAQKDLAIEAAKKAKEVSIDKPTAPGQAAFDIEDTSVDYTEEVNLEELESQMRKDLKLSTEKKEKVKAAARKIFGTALPSITNPRAYRLALAKAFKVELKSEIQDIFGTEKKYNAFLEKYIPVFHNLIDKETWIQIERLAPKGKKIFAEKRRITKVVEIRKLQEEGLISKDIKPASGPNLITLLPTPSTRKIMAFFRGEYKSPNTGRVETMEDVLGYTIKKSAFGPRKDSLAEAVLVELGFDASVDVLNSEREIAEKRREVDKIVNKEQLVNDIELLAKAIDRNPNIKFSKGAIVLNQFDDLLGKIEKQGFKNVFDEKGKIKVKFYGKQYLEEVWEPIYELGNKGGLFTAKEMNKQLKELFKGLRIKADNTLGDTSERAVFELFERANFLAPGFQLSEKKVDIPAFHTFVGGKFQNADIMFVLRNAVQVAMEVKFAVDGTVNAGKIGVKSFNSKNGTYEINEALPEGVKEVMRKSYDKTMKVVLEMQDLLINEFGYPKTLDLSEHKFLMDKNGVAKSPNGKVVYTMVNNKPIWSKKIKALKAKSNQTTTDNGDVVTYHYNKKGNFYITFVGAGKGKGVYYIGSDPLNVAKELGIEKLESNEDGFLFKTRLFTSSVQSQKDGVKKKVGYKLRLNGESVVNTSNMKKTSKFNIKSEKDVKAFKQAVNKSILASPNLGKGVKDLNNAINFSRSANNPTKGITVLDFDDTLATSKSLIRFTKPDGTTGTLNAEQYASTYEELTELGYKWDFSEFNKVVGGKIAPLFQKALKLQGKFGAENMFVLTARPPQAAKAIFDFLKANGLNIPIKNITGLGNSTAEAKADWMAGKVAEGYNDFYFADDAMQNVKAVKDMLGQFDVKSKVQQAKIKFSKEMSGDFNDILEQTTGVDSKKAFSEAQAKIRGARTKYKGIIPASAQDFMGLMYNFIGKGKQGDRDIAFFKKALVDPFARAINELNTSRQSAADDYKNLQKQFPDVKKIINKNIKDSAFTNDQAVRVYLWNKAGFAVPGLSQRDLKALVEHVEANPDLQAYADAVGLISKKEAGYSAPGDYWLAESITSDLLSDGAIGDARSEFLAEWQQNVDQIFSKENLNKIEAVYGSKFREALEDVLYRMKTGRNRPAGGGRMMNMYMNWVNNSVGAIMFFNMRSAILQTISATNYINWSDNNPLKAAAAFANQPQYWKDFSMIFNSDYLKQRRSGNKRGINEAELSAAVAGAENKAKAAIAWLLKKGFLPTQIADSFAIASGGATFYRNRVKKYIKEGMSQNQAGDQAFLDFQETTEVSQQSARPDMISQQQASPLGRLILSFQNTPMQYARIMNKAARDLANGRGDAKTHISKIAYYGVVQSIIFGALQSALFASLGEDDEEKFDKKKERILNGMVDSWLSGVGYGGKAVSTIKNTIRTFLEQRDKGFMADHTYTILSLLSFSPPIGSKLRKIYSAIQTDKFNKDVFMKRGFTLDNPIWSAIGNVVEGITNIPLGRLSNKMLNVDNALDSNNEFWQRAALLLGWSTWDLGIKDPDIEGIKTEIKAEKKVESKKKQKIKSKKNKEEKKKLEEIENKTKIEENKKKQAQEKKDGKKDIKCAAISKSGNRCKTKIEAGDSFCTIHEEVKQSKSGKKVQCKKVKSNKKRCGMKTAAASGYCYYHD